jgi:hypothetical protein
MPDLSTFEIRNLFRDKSFAQLTPDTLLTPFPDWHLYRTLQAAERVAEQ